LEGRIMKTRADYILIWWQPWDTIDTGSSLRDGCNEPTLPTKHCHVRTVIDEGGRDYNEVILSIKAERKNVNRTEWCR
jgi:hypothetical protein